jgi:hypothetical protein
LLTRLSLLSGTGSAPVVRLSTSSTVSSSSGETSEPLS